ncbi:MAG: hypothetical protein EOO85_22515, partial [Pedobacter sp.]
MKSLKLFILLFAVTLATSYAQPPVKAHFDSERWTEYIEGNMPLVISVPHGGTTLLDSIPLRDCKDAVTVTDSKTIELAL